MFSIPSWSAAAFPVVLLLFARPVAADPCPASEAWLVGPAVIPITIAQYDSSRHDEMGYLFSRGAFDLLVGTSAILHAELYPGQTRILMRDAFDVVGLPPGTPLMLDVEFDVDGTFATPGCNGSGCHAGLYASIGSGDMLAEASESAEMFTPETRPVHLAPRLVIPLVAGFPRLIEFMLLGGHAPGGDHRVEAEGRICFAGLPAGAVIVSCQGYAGSPTPAQAASWGRLKAAYR